MEEVVEGEKSFPPYFPNPAHHQNLLSFYFIFLFTVRSDGPTARRPKNINVRCYIKKRRESRRPSVWIKDPGPN